MLKTEWIKQGFIDEPVAEGTDLKAEIRRLAKEKGAIILAHYYTIGDIQDIADFVGDSLALARKAAETDAKMMVMCGVHFMAETCKLLSPDKTVLCPDLNAGCSLADSCKAEDLKKYKEEHPGYQVISYVNTTAAVKALTDVVVTSGNAKKVVDQLPAGDKYIFGPDCCRYGTSRVSRSRFGVGRCQGKYGRYAEVCTTESCKTIYSGHRGRYSARDAAKLS